VRAADRAASGYDRARTTARAPSAARGQRRVELGGDEQVARGARDEILADLDLRDAAGTLGEDEEWLALKGVVIFIAGEPMGENTPRSIRIRRSEIEAWWIPEADFSPLDELRGSA